MRDLVRFAALPVVVIGLTLFGDNRFLLRVITLTLVWAAAGVAWNLVAKAGQISLAHSAFFGVSAYAFTILVRRDPPISPWIGMLVGMLLAVILAVVIGWPTFRLKGFYFTLATIAFPLILELLVSQFGEPEMTIPFKPDGGWAFLEFSDARTYIWILLVVLILFLILTSVVDRSTFGFALRATRDNEILARAVGLRTTSWKMAAFAISAAMSAIVAVLWVKSVLRVTTAEETFGVEIVIVMLSVASVGGVGRTWAPVVGSAILTPLALYLDHFFGDSIAGIEELVYGLALVGVALFFPDGLLSIGGSRTIRSHPLRTRRKQAAGSPRSGEGGDLLKIEGVAISFSGLTVLEDVSFDVAPGARVGLIGPNGAGKTTLFNILTGHLKPSTGVVQFAGRSIVQMSAPERFQLGMSRTFQIPQGFHHLTVRDNVVTAAIGARVADPEGAASEALDRVGLLDLAESDLSHLTVAETKFLELARAIVSKPRLLLLDEPLAGLNAAERERFFETVDRVVDPEVAVLVIEHSVRSLASFVDRLVALDSGRIIADADPQTVIAEERVITAYLGAKWRTDVAHP